MVRLRRCGWRRWRRAAHRRQIVHYVEIVQPTQTRQIARFDRHFSFCFVLSSLLMGFYSLRWLGIWRTAKRRPLFTDRVPTWIRRMRLPNRNNQTNNSFVRCISNYMKFVTLKGKNVNPSKMERFTGTGRNNTGITLAEGCDGLCKKETKERRPEARAGSESAPLKHENNNETHTHIKERSRQYTKRWDYNFLKIMRWCKTKINVSFFFPIFLFYCLTAYYNADP